MMNSYWIHNELGIELVTELYIHDEFVVNK